MSFDSRKTQAAQQIASILSIELDRCRHTTAQSVIDGTITAGAGVTNIYTGTLAISGGTATSFDLSSPYILWDSEIIKVNVNSDLELDITGRAQLGTIADSHLAGAIKLMHSGEADGSCYATPFTCTSPDSYDEDTKLIFDFPSTQLDVDEKFYNGFQSWSHRPATVDPGQTMGSRAKLSFSLKDSVDNDIYVPYPGRRTNAGTLFSKLLARHPNFEGRPCKLLTGFNPLDFDIDNFITREYMMDSVNLNKGVMDFTSLDPLILTEDKKSKAPVASDGVLSVLIDDLSTTVTYTNAPAFDYGVATSTAFVRIDSEVIECTVLSDFVLTIVDRASGGTQKKDHKVKATVQECLVYDDVNVVEIIEELMVVYSNVPSRFIDDYSAIKAATASITLTANINKPTSIKKLINELVKNGDLTIFYDEENQLIRIKQVKDAFAGSVNINEEEHIEKNSVRIERSVDTQFTRYTVAWDPNDITKVTDDENFSILFQSINLTNELPDKKGETNEKDIFFNRWLTDSNNDVIIGASIAQKLIDRSDQVPEIATFNLDVESVFNTQGSVLELGTIFNFATSRIVNVDGSNKAANHQVLSMKDLGGMKYQIKSRLFQDPIEDVTVDFTISENKEDYDLSTEFAPVAGNYIVLIDTGVTIGGTSTSTPSFTTGAQAPGVTIDFINRGSILGNGGAGGDAGILDAPNPNDTTGEFDQVGTVGLVGGNAFEATISCTINTGSGAIWAGGGGGAGEQSTVVTTVGPTTINPNAGNGGCGGQGYAISFGGLLGTVSIEFIGIVDTGVNGVNGTQGSEGSQGSNAGGIFGENGTDESGILGGLSGYAIVTNGNTVSVISGDNPINIKGRRI